MNNRSPDSLLAMDELARNALVEGILITAPDGHILSANDAFLSISGYERSEILGRTCSFFQGPQTDAKTLDAIRQAQINVMPFFGEVLNYSKDGTTFWNELTISPLRDEGGHLTHFVGVIRDVSARH